MQRSARGVGGPNKLFWPKANPCQTRALSECLGPFLAPGDIQGLSASQVTKATWVTGLWVKGKKETNKECPGSRENPGHALAILSKPEVHSPSAASTLDRIQRRSQCQTSW